MLGVAASMAIRNQENLTRSQPPSFFANGNFPKGNTRDTKFTGWDVDGGKPAAGKGTSARQQSPGFFGPALENGKMRLEQLIAAMFQSVGSTLKSYWQRLSPEQLAKAKAPVPQQYQQRQWLG